MRCKCLFGKKKKKWLSLTLVDQMPCAANCISVTHLLNSPVVRDSLGLRVANWIEELGEGKESAKERACLLD